MHIFHTIDSAGLYGAEAVVLNLAAEQQRRGDAPVVVSIASPGEPARALESAAALAGLRVLPFRMKNGFNLRGARALSEAALLHGADVIHSHGYKSNILLALLGRRQLPVMTTLHGWTATSTFSKLGLYRFLDQRLLGRLDGVALVNRAMHHLPAIRRLHPERVRYIPNGLALDDPPFDGQDPLCARLASMRADGKVIVGGVGRLSAEKNFGALVAAAAQVGELFGKLRLVLLGDGPEMASLKRQTSDLRMDSRILFTGYVANAKRYLSLFDILVVPSLTEGLPMILLEAMNAGVPVIASAVGEIPAVLHDCGTLVSPGDVAALAEALAKTLQDPTAGRAHADFARVKVQAEYGAGLMADRYQAFYRQLIKARAYAG